MTAMRRCLNEVGKGRPVLAPVCFVYGFVVGHVPSLISPSRHPRYVVPGLDTKLEERATTAAEMIVRLRILHGYIDSGSSPISWARTTSGLGLEL